MIGMVEEKWERVDFDAVKLEPIPEHVKFKKHSNHLFKIAVVLIVIAFGLSFLLTSVNKFSGGYPYLALGLGVCGYSLAVSAWVLEDKIKYNTMLRTDPPPKTKIEHETG